jgi:hypothetical protein
MSIDDTCTSLFDSHVVFNNHASSDYFCLLKALIDIKDEQSRAIVVE